MTTFLMADDIVRISNQVLSMSKMGRKIARQNKRDLLVRGGLRVLLFAIS